MASANSRPLSHAALIASFDYDPDTGLFTRKVCADRSHVGDTLTALDDWGYVRFRVFGAKYRAHVLAWFYVFGEWPRHQIDHIDEVKTNNRIGNLRDVPQSWNQHNRRRARKDNALGVLGVRRVGDKFSAQITTPNGKRFLGHHSTIEAAKRAYDQAKKLLHAGLIRE